MATTLRAPVNSSWLSPAIAHEKAQNVERISRSLVQNAPVVNASSTSYAKNTSVSASKNATALKTSFLSQQQACSSFVSRSTSELKKGRFFVVKSVLNNNHPEECNVDQGDGQYYEASVVDAVGMVPAKSTLYMRMSNGVDVEVAHVNPQAGRLLYHNSTPTIFLRMTSDSNLMLPIVVSEAALHAALRGMRQEPTGRPNSYEVMKDLASMMHHEIHMVRITQRVSDTYYARIYFARKGETQLMSVDARPSDAINLAVRCKVPIYVNRNIVTADAVRVVNGTTIRGNYVGFRASNRLDDCAVEGNDPVAAEIVLLRSMMVAAHEERYRDAAKMRDELKKLRNNQQKMS